MSMKESMEEYHQLGIGDDKEDKVEPEEVEVYDVEINEQAKEQYIEPRIGKPVSLEEKDLIPERVIVEARAEFYPQIDQLVQEIDNLAETISRVAEEEISLDIVKSNIKEALYTWLLADDNTFKKVEGILGDSSSPEDFIQKLQDCRKELVFFNYRSKWRIDGVIYKLENFATAMGAQGDSLAEQWRRAIRPNEQKKLFDSQIDNLSNKYELIMLKAWEVDDKLSRLQGAGNIKVDFPHELELRLQKLLNNKQNYSAEILQRIKNEKLTSRL